MILMNPGYLFLLFFFIPLFYFRHLRKPHRTYPLTIKIWQGPIFRGRASLQAFFYWVLSLSFWTGAALLVISIAGPAVISTEKQFVERGNDIIVVLDESPSMAALDFDAKKRFDTATEIIKDFVSSRENDSIGLVTFGREAALRVPPTLDYRHVAETVGSLTLAELGDGTAIGLGVVLACNHLKNSEAHKKIIILVTDGEYNAGNIDPETAARIAESLSITLYTIGIGSRGQVPIEFTDQESGKSFRGTFESGFDEEILTAMADLTGGMYFRAADFKSLRSAFEGVESREQGNKSFKLRVKARERHRLFLGLGLLFLFIDLFFRRLILKDEAW